ncbi:hypothetical protein [Alteromonas macleodii]
MTDGDVCPPKLAIVIHTEEEFDWGGGFNVSDHFRPSFPCGATP